MERRMSCVVVNALRNGVFVALRTAFAGIAQVFLQNKPISGALFLFAIASNSLGQAIFALVGAVSGAISARTCNFPEEDIERGLHGFNGVLIGIALYIYLGPYSSSIFLTVVCSAASVVVGNLLGKSLRMPYYTMPFVILTSLAMELFPIHTASDVVMESGKFDLAAAVLNGVGQGLLQTGRVSGLLIVLGLALSNPMVAFIAIVMSVISALVGVYSGISVVFANEGLLGYNVVLAALAMRVAKRPLWGVLAACSLAYLFTWVCLYIGVVPLTAPFVLAAWLTQLVSRISYRRAC